MKHRYLLIIYLILTIINLFAEWSAHQTLIYVSKPLLLTILSLWFYLNIKSHWSAFSVFVLLGLIFSVGGDTFLMFEENGNADTAIWFLLGLGCFLLTHLFYFLGFLKYPDKSKGFITKKWWWAIPFVLFYIGFNYYLRNDLADLQLPVLVYSGVITLMAITALNLKGKDILEKHFWWIFGGVLLFMLSDTVIALNKFKSHEVAIPQPRLAIMVLYLLGQYLIASGTVKAIQRQAA